MTNPHIVTARLKHQQFDALVELRKLRNQAVIDAARYHLVYGMPLPAAAEVAGARYDTTWRAVRTLRRGLDLAATAKNVAKV